MSRVLRWLVWALSPFLFYFGMTIVGALVPASGVDRTTQVEDEAWIVLVEGAIHYDILLPLDDETRATFAFLSDAGVPVDGFNGAWLSIGWGSEAFYTTAGSYSDITAGAVFTAVTGDRGVMRFEVYGPLPEDPSLRRIPVSFAQLDALRTAIRADLAEAPRPLPLDGYSDTDAFYPAAGRFHAFRTCNVWVGGKLASAGLPFGWWTPTPLSVRLSIWWNGLQHG